MQVTINVNDPILLNVINKMVDRSNTGIDKYGTTLKEDKSGLTFFLKQIQTELMDATLYLQRLKEEISTLREEKERLKAVNDIDVIDAFEMRVKKNNTPSKQKHGPGSNHIYTIEIDDPEVIINDPFLGRYISDVTNSHFKFRHPEDND